MPLPFFYSNEIEKTANQFILNEDISRHVAQVLRMPNGGHLQLTDGMGNLFVAEITNSHKKNCALRILSTLSQQPSAKNFSIAISLIKNAHRFEWFLEKATEIGIKEIIPLVCSRTEKQHYRAERMKNILISAMLQSQQAWLPVLHEPVSYNDYMKSAGNRPGAQKFIAHCEEDKPRAPLSDCLPFNNPTILIGPEGDFTPDEIALASQNDFKPVALGNTRLRTETAGVVAAAILSLA